MGVLMDQGRDVLRFKGVDRGLDPVGVEGDRSLGNVYAGLVVGLQDLDRFVVEDYKVIGTVSGFAAAALIQVFDPVDPQAIQYLGCSAVPVGVGVLCIQ